MSVRNSECIWSNDHNFDFSKNLGVMSAAPPDPCPSYWECLTELDKTSYVLLRNTLSSPVCKNRRNRSAQTFQEIIDTIKAFVIRNDQEDINRGMVCGLVWIGDYVAINIRQLRLLLSKCKSSINGSFQMIGYSSVPSSAEATTLLINQFPFMKNSFSEMRQWTLRQQSTTNKLSEILLTKGKCEFLTPPPDLKSNEEGFELRMGDDMHSAPETVPSCDIGDIFSSGQNEFGFWDRLGIFEGNEENFFPNSP